MKDNKYDKILSIATDLINREGFRKTSFQKIADKVGLHRTSLFHYLKNKEELLLRVLERSVDEIGANLEEISSNNELEPEEKLKKAIDNHLALHTKSISNTILYLNELDGFSKKNQRIFLGERKKYEKNFEKIITEMKRKGYFKRLDTKIVTFSLLGVLNWVPKWYRSDGRLPIEKISNIFYKIILGKG